MAFCINCGQELVEGAKFCSKCGAEVNAPQSETKAQRKTVYDGEIHKCPSCGAVLPSFATVCQSCGYELRGNRAAESVKSLHSNVTNAKSESEKIEIIKTFPIPTSKEDIYEFMILASSNFDETYYTSHKNEEDISDAWLAKIEQCYQKAKLSLSDEAEFKKISGIYESVQQRIKQAEKAKKVNALLPILCIAAGLILIMTGQIFIQTFGLTCLGLGIAILCTRKKKPSEIATTQTASTGSEYTQKKRGYSSWSTGVKVLWIILNIYTIGIPAIIYACCNKKR